MNGQIWLNMGGETAAQLLTRLKNAGVQMNAYAEQYMSDSCFPAELPAVEITLRLVTPDTLGCGTGASLQTIFACAKERGLLLCPAETGAYLRLALQDQRRSQSSVLTGEHRAPEGAITVASAPLHDADDFPKGVYLRNVDDVLWLRGYCCTEEYGWPGDSVFAFAENSKEGV